MKVTVDRELCASTGMCTTVAPSVFEVGGDGSLQVLVDEPPADLREMMEEAAAICPTGAITIIDQP